MKILAIDIGSGKIKCAVFDAKFNRFDLTHAESLPVSDALSNIELAPHQLSPGQIEALTQVWAPRKDSIDRVITNIPYNLYTTRLLSFPFSERKKMLAAAPFQIEDEVPFDLENCILAHQIFPAESGVENSVLTGVAQKTDLQDFIGSIVNTTGIDPDVLTSTQSATYAYLARSPDLYAGKAIAMINLGHRSSSIHIYKDSKPVMGRTSMVGGFHITAAIAKNYGISMEEAEKAKLASGFLAPPGIEQSDDQRAFSDLIALVLEPVFHDFYQALMAYFSRYRERVTQIYVCGGTSLFPGTSDYLAARWQVPVHPLKALSTFPSVSASIGKGQELLLSQALILGVSQVESRSKDTHNFRTGVLRRQGTGFQLNLKALETPFKVFCAVYLFAVFTMSIQYFFLTNQYLKREIRFDAAIRRVFGSPKAAQLFQLKQNPEKLRKDAKAKVDDLRAKLAGGTEEPSFSPLGILKELSDAVSPSTQIEIRQMNLSRESLNLKLQAANMTPIKSTADILKGLKFSSEVSAPKEEARDAKKLTASLQVKLKPNSRGKN